MRRGRAARAAGAAAMRKLGHERSLLAFQRLRSSRTALLDVKAFGLLTVPVGFPG